MVYEDCCEVVFEVGPSLNERVCKLLQKTETIYVENPLQVSRLIKRLAKQKKNALMNSVVKTEPFITKFYNQILPLVSGPEIR